MYASDRLNEILDQAIDLPRLEREAFLDRACAGDPALRDRIDALIRDSEGDVPDDFLPLPDFYRDLPQE
jgi:hypothetical protein